jgi:hypothetical protein
MGGFIIGFTGIINIYPINFFRLIVIPAGHHIADLIFHPCLELESRDGKFHGVWTLEERSGITTVHHLKENSIGKQVARKKQPIALVGGYIQTDLYSGISENIPGIFTGYYVCTGEHHLHHFDIFRCTVGAGISLYRVCQYLRITGLRQ